MEIKRIEKLYPNWYSKDSDLSYEDQLFIWESVPLPNEDIDTLREIEINDKDVYVNGNINGTYKHHINTKKKLSKKEAIASLRKCHYRTAPREVAYYLEILLSNEKTYPSHWLFIAQHYTPKTINSVLNQMIKSVERGDVTIKSPASYFTKMIKYRKKRKKYHKNKELELPTF